MVPVLDKHNRPIPNEWKETKADKELAPYDYDLAITIADENGEDLIIPVWRFIEMFLRVKDKKGRFSVFRINDAQIQFYKELCEQKRKGKRMRVNILKARQLGFSTFIAAVLFVLTILVPNQTACIIADIADHATNLFDKYKFYYHNLPAWLKEKLPLLKSNAKELVVDYGMGQSSKVRILVQGDNAGRSDTCQYLHLSEVAFWDDIEGTTTSVLQTVDDTNPNSIIAYETTANGVNYYKTIWDEDVGSGDDGYKALFFPWYLDPTYVLPYDGFELEDWETKLKDKLDLSYEQIAWYHAQYLKLRRNLAKLRQEFPSTPIEAFIVTGTNKFNMELVQQQKEWILEHPPIKQGFFTYKKTVSQDGEVITISNINFVEVQNGDAEIKIYEEPKAGHPYVITNDPANGGEDYFATHVFDNYTGCQCAVYHKNKCDADDAAYQMYCLLKYYSRGIPVMATGETNTTSRVLKLLYKCGHRFIYQDQDYDALSGRFQDQFGYKTKQNNRLVMIDEFAEAFRDDPSIIRDWATICEMENFQVVKNSTTQKEKIQAVSGAHDDLVMSACGFFYCRHAQVAVPSQKTAVSAKNIENLEWEMEEKRRKVSQERRVYQIWD